MKSGVALALLLAASVLSGVAGTPELQFEAGSHAYTQGDWSQALEHWRQLESSGWRSGELFYNLGNAYYKLGEIGEAILYWERAAKLTGENQDIAANLAIARIRLADKLDEPVRLPVWNWFDRFRAKVSLGSLSTIAVLGSILLFGMLALRRWMLRRVKAQNILKWGAVVMALALAASSGLLGLRAHDDLAHRYGVLTVSEADVWSAPAEGSGKLLFTLHEGTKVRVLRDLQGWLEISAGKDKQGWVARDKLGVI
jgi:tetratricopeptide (TPR) repeat protein